MTSGKDGSQGDTFKRAPGEQPRDAEIVFLKSALAETHRKLGELEIELDAQRKLAARRQQDIAESNHRVGNSFHLIAATLRRQEQELSDGDGKAALKAAVLRIVASGQLHRKLSSGNGATLDFSLYLRDIVKEIGATIPVSCLVQVKRIELDGHTASALAVAVNELVVNAIKYAGDKKPIDISCYLENGKLYLSVRDHGPGFDCEASKTGLHGLSYVRGIVEHLNGELTINNANGALVTLSIPYPTDT